MAVWHPTATGMIFEHHHGTDNATTMLNHKTGTTTASLIGSWTGGTGFMDISAALKAMDYGFYLSGRFGHVAVVVDPTSAVGICASSGTNEQLKATGRCWFDENPTAAQTVTINGQVVTFVAGAPGANQVQIMLTPQLTAYGLATLINANPGTFAMTAKCPAGNSVIELTAITGGTAGNSIGTVTGSSAIRFVSASGSTAVTALSSGSAGETVNFGINGTASAFNGRNYNIGGGGLASITYPGAGYYYVTSCRTRRDFPYLRVYSGGALLAEAVGTTSGRLFSTANLKSGDNTAFGTGTCKIGYAAAWDNLARPLTPAEDLAGYLAVQAAKAAEGGGITVN